MRTQVRFGINFPISVVDLVRSLLSCPVLLEGHTQSGQLTSKCLMLLEGLMSFFFFAHKMANITSSLFYLISMSCSLSSWFFIMGYPTEHLLNVYRSYIYIDTTYIHRTPRNSDGAIVLGGNGFPRLTVSWERLWLTHLRTRPSARETVVGTSLYRHKQLVPVDHIWHLLPTDNLLPADVISDRQHVLEFNFCQQIVEFQSLIRFEIFGKLLTYCQIDAK